MNENKTRATEASVGEYIQSRANAEQEEDCTRLIDLFKRVTKEEPKMWGPSIVGFGSYHYRYQSGREGEMCLTGFAIRKAELVVYLVAEGEEQDSLLARLGRHRMGKACLYFKRLSDLDLPVLEKIVTNSVSAIKRRYG